MIFVGVDPGTSGGLVCIYSVGEKMDLLPTPEDDQEVWDWFRDKASYINWGARAVIERISPGFKGTGKSQMAKLYGNYRMLRAFLVAARIPYEEMQAHQWQQYLGIPKRRDSESPSQWKNRLKRKANSLYPHVKVTLATADALLIAEVCRQKYEVTCVEEVRHRASDASSG